MSSTLSSDEQLAFEHFLTRRKLHDCATEVLAKVREAKNLTRADLSASKSLTYAQLAELLLKAVNNNWLANDDLLKMLDESEVSGRQHVCVFMLPHSEKERLFKTIREPTELVPGPSHIDEFIGIPTHSRARILRESSEEVLVKIVGVRSYWLSEFEQDDPDEQLIRRWKQKERSALIIKCNLRDELV